MMRTCEQCTTNNDNISRLHDELVGFFQNNGTVKVQQWRDRTLEDLELAASDFAVLFIDKFEAFLPHCFVAKHQNNHFEYVKSNLSQTEMIVMSDFAENYKFVIQDAIQSYHWNNSQATLIPFACFALNENGVLQQRNVMCVSDELRHDTVTWHLARDELVSHVKSKFPHISKLIYFTDGASAHFKNFKSIGLLSAHSSLYNLEASWSFFGTGHGKSVCDALSGACKQTAHNHSLRAIDGNQIRTPLELFNFLRSKITKIHFFFLDSNESISVRQHLEKYFKSFIQIKGIRGLHCFQAVSEGRVLCAKLAGETLTTRVFSRERSGDDE